MPRGKRWLQWLGGVALLAVAPVAQATPVLLLVDQRQIRFTDTFPSESGGLTTDSAVFDPDAPFAPFDVSSRVFGQRESTVTPLRFGARGFVELEHNETPDGASSRYRVRFEVVAPTLATLSGTLELEGTRTNAESGAFVRLSSRPSRGAVFSAALPRTGDPSTGAVVLPFDWTGILPPGEYEFNVLANATDFGFSFNRGIARYEFALDFSPDVVPEPTTAVLLGFGLAVMAARRA